jgi:hypothetical protein
MKNQNREVSTSTTAVYRGSHHNMVGHRTRRRTFLCRAVLKFQEGAPLKLDDTLYHEAFLKYVRSF